MFGSQSLGNIVAGAGKNNAFSLENAEAGFIAGAIAAAAGYAWVEMGINNKKASQIDGRSLALAMLGSGGGFAVGKYGCEGVQG